MATTTDTADAPVIVQTVPLGAPPWPTLDPFLFCVHHLDHYPAGNETMGPDAPLDGRAIGQDFANVDGWNMYHGSRIPGFPQHPHRGFETITVVRRGLIDHSDSLGATARFGPGDAQWMTAGHGIVHAEMFPLVERDGDNASEFFQIWLNLPAANKLVDPYFTMLWSDRVPVVTTTDADGRSATVTVVAGSYGDQAPPPPPPDSWASNPEADVAIWTIDLDEGASVELPPADPESTRVLYVFGEGSLSVAGHIITPPTGVVLRADAAVALEAGAPATALLLQGRPIAEPVAQHGPFVMNTRDEIITAIEDYQRTGFGGWPWDDDDPVHPRDQDRFARHPDGRIDGPAVATSR